MNLSSDLIAEFCAWLPARGYQGDAALDMPTRIVHATDNSIYQILPQAVLFPRTQNDIQIILQLAQDAKFQSVKFTPRGGGTGTNGQSLNDTIIIDTSRYLNQILEINPMAGYVRVEPGVVLDQLNAALATKGYFFPPDVSPSKSATLGGMVSTDACGKGSTVYGKTGDYVVSMKCVLADGSMIDTATYRDDTLKDIIAADYDAACKHIPQMPRGLSAYNIPGVFANGELNLNRLIAGSEGSLVVLQELTLKIIPRPLHHAMITIAYDDFDKALRHVGKLLTFKPTAVETIDNNIVDLARGDIVWHGLEEIFGAADLSNVRAMHFVEFERNSEDEILRNVRNLCNGLADDTEALLYFPTNQPDQIKTIKEMRKKCVGLLGNMRGARRPIPFMEDTAVPPQHLADYIAELRAFLSSHNLDCGMFGHSDAGCLHTRPALNLRDVGDEKFIRLLTDGAVQILKKYGGVLWGEHGKGMRAAYTAEIVGTEYYALMQKIKAHFDPASRLNPGKICALPGQKLIEIDAASLRGQFDRQITDEKIKQFPKAVECNGNGLCFSVMPDDTMCPSYKVTRDRRHSPKGRAGLLREFMRLQNTDAAAAQKFAPAVKDTLDGCLSCKACTAVCPIHVNIPDMKTDFLADFYKARLRPLRSYLLAWSEVLAPLMAKLPFKIPGLFGLCDLPAPPKISLASIMQQHGFLFANDQNIAAAKNPILILQDAYTSYFEPHVVLAALQLLRKLGFAPLVIPYFQSGKSYHLQGFKEKFHNIARRNTARIEKYHAPMIGIDPAMTLIYRDEYPKTLGRKLKVNVQLLQEFLVAQNLPPGKSGEYDLFLHCTEKTAMPESEKLWQKIFTDAGIRLNIRRTGCCGMAGAYGHQREHQHNSKALYEFTWQDQMTEHAAVTGYSCRSQAMRCTTNKPRHPVEILNSAL